HRIAIVIGRPHLVRRIGGSFGFLLFCSLILSVPRFSLPLFGLLLLGLLLAERALVICRLGRRRFLRLLLELSLVARRRALLRRQILLPVVEIAELALPLQEILGLLAFCERNVVRRMAINLGSGK